MKRFVNPSLGRSIEKTDDALAPQDLEFLPSINDAFATNVSTALVGAAEAPLYAEEVLAEIQEAVPHFSDDIDIEAIPNFYTDNIDGDAMAVAASLTSKRKLEHKLKNIDLVRLRQFLGELMTIEGALTVAVVDWQSGLSVGSQGSEMDIDVAAAGDSEVVRAKRDMVKELGIDDKIEDILITLETQYHLIRFMSAHIFLYVVLDRAQSNLALALHQVSALESQMQF